MHLVEEYQNYNLDRGWVEWVQLWRPQEKGGVVLLYNTVHRKFNQLETRCGRESQHPAEWALRPPIEQLQFWGSDELRIRQVGEKMLDWGTCPREAGPPGLQLSSPGERKRNAIMANRVGVNMSQFCLISNSLSHTTLSNKVRGIFF